MPRQNELTGSQIIDYHGDPNLALGGGAGLKVYGETDASGMTQTGRELALLAHANNLEVWKQRITDRDNLRKMIDEGEAPVDNILEQNRPYVEDKINQARQYFYDNANDILDDPAKYRQYKAKLADAQSAAKQANTNFLIYSAEQKQLGDATNTTDATNRKQFLTQQLDKIKGDPNALIDPYVAISPFKLDVVNAAAARLAATPKRVGDNMVTDAPIDVDKTFQDYQNKYLMRENNDGFKEYAGLLTSDPKRVDALNVKLAEVNTKLQAAGAKTVPLISATDAPWQIAAKATMAETDPVQHSETYAKDQVDDQTARATLAERAANDRAQIGLGYARIAQDAAELKQKKDQWAATQKGGDTTKNAAFDFANRVYGDMAKLADANGVINPDKLRQLNAEQLKYAGIESGDGVTPLTIKPGDALQLVNGQIRVLSDAAPLADGSGRWDGKFDPNRSTNVYNIATNRLNEENKNAGSKELNGYMPIDTGSGGVSETTTGASTTVRGGGSTQFKSAYKLPNGATVNIDELRAKGYSDKKIQENIKSGVLK